MTTLTGAKPHPIFLAGRWVESPDPLVVANPANPSEPAGSTFHATRGAVRGGRQEGRGGFEVDAHAARLRARSDPAEHLGGDPGAPRGARPADRAGGRQADQGLADRGGPRGR